MHQYELLCNRLSRNITKRSGYKTTVEKSVKAMMKLLHAIEHFCLTWIYSFVSNFVFF